MQTQVSEICNRIRRGTDEEVTTTTAAVSSHTTEDFLSNG